MTSLHSIFALTKRVAVGLALALVLPMTLRAAPTTPELDQVRQLIRSNLTGVTDAELEQHALDGLLHGLRGKVRLLNAQTNAADPGQNLSRSVMLDDGIGYLRVRTVAAGLADEVATTCQAMDATNKLKGIVLDLRFAEGDDYAAAVTVANLFVADERELLDWGSGMMKSIAKTNALVGPVAVLVNNETTGSPEALAALLRETGVGLLLGNTTRGAAMTAKEFLLSNGQRLRIATTPVKLAGDATLTLSGVVPDIQVAVNVTDEKLFLNDPYAVIAKATTLTNSAMTATNRITRRTRTTEADLVRARREGVNFDPDQPLQRDSEVEKPVIRDPALARAVDLLKGLAVVRRPR